MSIEFDADGAGRESDTDDNAHFWAETVVAVAGTMAAAILVSSIGVLIYLA